MTAAAWAIFGEDHGRGQRVMAVAARDGRLELTRTDGTEVRDRRLLPALGGWAERPSTHAGALLLQTHMAMEWSCESMGETDSYLEARGAAAAALCRMPPRDADEVAEALRAAEARADEQHPDQAAWRGPDWLITRQAEAMRPVHPLDPHPFLPFSASDATCGFCDLTAVDLVHTHMTEDQW